jgi:hypothetical protein
MNLTCVMCGSNGHSLTDYHNSDANSTPDTGEWGQRGRQWAGERKGMGAARTTVGGRKGPDLDLWL